MNEIDSGDMSVWSSISCAIIAMVGIVPRQELGQAIVRGALSGACDPRHTTQSSPLIQGRRHMELGLVQRQDTALEVSWLPTLKLWRVSLSSSVQPGRTGSSCDRSHLQIWRFHVDRDCKLKRCTSGCKAASPKTGVAFC